MICRKASFTISVSAVMIPDANFLSSRAQNRGFCAFLAFGTPVFWHFEHKIGVFVLGLLLSAASGRVIADIFEILPGWGKWYNGTLAVKSSVMIGWIGDKLLD